MKIITRIALTLLILALFIGLACASKKSKPFDQPFIVPPKPLPRPPIGFPSAKSEPTNSQQSVEIHSSLSSSVSESESSLYKAHRNLPLMAFGTPGSHTPVVIPPHVVSMINENIHNIEKPVPPPRPDRKIGQVSEKMEIHSNSNVSPAPEENIIISPVSPVQMHPETPKHGLFLDDDPAMKTLGYYGFCYTGAPVERIRVPNELDLERQSHGLKIFGSADFVQKSLANKCRLDANARPVLCQIAMKEKKFLRALKVYDSDFFLSSTKSSGKFRPLEIMSNLKAEFGHEIIDPILMSNTMTFVPYELVFKDSKCSFGMYTRAFEDVTEQWSDHATRVHWNVLTREEAGRKRVVALGDFHGDLGQMYNALYMMRVVDSMNDWIGGNTMLVVVGDMIDRGPFSRHIVEYLYKLKQGYPGNVILLNGNHELRALMGGTKGDLLKLDADEEFAHVSTKKADRQLARQQAYMPGEEVGKLLVDLPSMARINVPIQRATSGILKSRKSMSIVFSHGDIHPEFAKMGVDNVNTMIHQDIVKYGTGKYVKLDRNDITQNSNGPHEYRGISDGKGDEDNQVSSCDMAVQSLKDLKVG